MWGRSYVSEGTFTMSDVGKERTILKISGAMHENCQKAGDEKPRYWGRKRWKFIRLLPLPIPSQCVCRIA